MLKVAALCLETAKSKRQGDPNQMKTPRKGKTVAGYRSATTTKLGKQKDQRASRKEKWGERRRISDRKRQKKRTAYRDVQGKTEKGPGKEGKKKHQGKNIGSGPR